VALVSVTRLRVRSWRFMPRFFIGALRAARQAGRAEGNVATSLLREARNTFWTRTAWESEQAMKAFMMAGVHRRLMRSLLEWCDEAAVVHWEQEEAALPSWEDAHARMQRDGRRSKVNHPSKAHTAYEIAAPVVRTTGELSFKR
jgi:hypothetical protein